MNLPPDLFSAIVYIGGQRFLGWFISAYLEKATWFQKLDADRKHRVVLYFAAIFAVVSFAMVRWTGLDVLGILNPLYLAMLGAALNFLSAIDYHYTNNNPTPMTSEERFRNAMVRIAAGDKVAGAVAGG